MAKAKLSLDDLKIESFITTADAANGGAVRAEGPTIGDTFCKASYGVGPCLGDTKEDRRTDTCQYTWEHTCIVGATSCCPDESRPGWASCGTTCAQTCDNVQAGCDTTAAAGCWVGQTAQNNYC
jgi:hypothetical protein